jgi:hypothetical protein
MKIKFFIIFLFLISGCEYSHNKLTKTNKFENIAIETPNTKFDLIFKKYLKREFNNQPGKTAKFILKSNLSFNSADTLSSNGLNTLKSTKCTVKYSLIDLQTGKVIKSGSFFTFPALSSSSSSLYSNDVSLRHIKERLSLISAKKLYMHVKLIVQALN